MEDFTKQQYTSICLDLINMMTTVSKTWAKCDINLLADLIEVIRFYRQFSK